MAFAHIIHPTDFSEVSNNALRLAAEIARLANSTIHLVHVFEKPYETGMSDGSGSLTSQVDKESLHDLKEDIQHKIEKLASQEFLHGIKLTRVLHADIAPWQFVEKIDPAHADLIVMGTRGKSSWLQNGLMGSTTERAIRYAPVPVLSVPNEASFSGKGDIKRILFATAFTYPVLDHWARLTEFAALFGAEILVAVMITPDNFVTSERAEQAFAELRAANTYPKVRYETYNVADVETGVSQLVSASGSNLLTMFTHGRVGFSRLINGSIVEDLTNQLSTPVLSFKEKQLVQKTK
jgi:nucleotide-binding universal stress UspA family protein